MATIAGNLAKRTFASSSTLNNVIKNVTVIGGGLMGSGIAQVRYFLFKYKFLSHTVWMKMFTIYLLKFCIIYFID